MRMTAKLKKPSPSSPKSQPKSSGRRSFLGSLLALPLAWLMPQSAHAEKIWHLPNGKFRNTYLGPIERSFSELRKAFGGKTRPPLIEFPLSHNDPQALAANKTKTTATWIGHCTILLQVGGLNIITDPQFSQRASPVFFAGPQRGTPPGLAIKDLPPIDIILISHNHYDHLDHASIVQLAKHSPQAHVYVPLKLASWFSNYGFAKVVELDWWEDTNFKNAKLTAVPSQHWSSRAIWDRNDTLWCGWTVHVNDFAFVFIGDSGYTQDFADINQRLGDFDLAAIPIGAYNPRWFMEPVHQNPAEAVQCFQDLGAKKALATHWGTFILTFEPMDEPPQRLATALAQAGLSGEDFWVMGHGETRELS